MYDKQLIHILYVSCMYTWTREPERRASGVAPRDDNGGALSRKRPQQPFSERPSRLRPRERQRDDLVSTEVRDVDLVAVDNDRTDVRATQIEGFGL